MEAISERLASLQQAASVAAAAGDAQAVDVVLQRLQQLLSPHPSPPLLALLLRALSSLFTCFMGAAGCSAAAVTVAQHAARMQPTSLPALLRVIEARAQLLRRTAEQMPSNFMLPPSSSSSDRPTPRPPPACGAHPDVKQPHLLPPRVDSAWVEEVKEELDALLMAAVEQDREQQQQQQQQLEAAYRALHLLALHQHADVLLCMRSVRWHSSSSRSRSSAFLAYLLSKCPHISGTDQEALCTLEGKPANLLVGGQRSHAYGSVVLALQAVSFRAL